MVEHQNLTVAEIHTTAIRIHTTVIRIHPAFPSPYAHLTAPESCNTPTHSLYNFPHLSHFQEEKEFSTRLHTLKQLAIFVCVCSTSGKEQNQSLLSLTLTKFQQDEYFSQKLAAHFPACLNVRKLHGGFLCCGTNLAFLGYPCVQYFSMFIFFVLQGLRVLSGVSRLMYGFAFVHLLI